MDDENLSRRERKKRETHHRLMGAALHLFREQGYDATTVEQIAGAADVAKGTFFNYFETKEAILPALVEWRLQQLEKALLPAHGAPASPVARIKLALRLVAEDPLSDPKLMRRLFAARTRHPGMRPAHALTSLLVKQVHQAQIAGEQVRVVPLATVALLQRIAVQALDSADVVKLRPIEGGVDVRLHQ